LLEEKLRLLSQMIKGGGARKRKGGKGKKKKKNIRPPVKRERERACKPQQLIDVGKGEDRGRKGGWGRKKRLKLYSRSERREGKEKENL